MSAEERFEVQEPLGRGAMGVVSRAYDHERKQVVALKRLLTPDAASIYRFKREFRALANVSHPNLVTLYDLVSSGDDWFFTMELVAGTDFLSFVRPKDPQRPSAILSQTREFGPDKAPVGGDTRAAAAAAATVASDTVVNDLSEEPCGLNTLEVPAATPELVDLERLESALVQLAEALVALHQTGHLHRDIKPSNILVRDDGRVVVLDFGIITELSGTRRLADDAVAGTPSYIAPELLDSTEPSEASDWYAFGVVLFQALTGKRPFGGGNDTVLRAKRIFTIPVEGLLESGAPPHLARLCTDLLQRDPELRPSGADVLRRIQDKRDSRAPAITAPPPPQGDESPLVGRDSELESLHSAWRDSRSGDGVAVFVHGPSGVGKSALVDRFLADLEAGSDAVVLAGRCYEQESVPYKGIDSLVDSIARFMLGLEDQEVERLLPSDVAALGRAFPVLGRVQEVGRHLEVVGRAHATNRSELQRRAFAALFELMEHLAGENALCLYIDDLQWGDVESAGFLARLLGPHGPPVLFIAGYRSEHIEASPLLPALFNSLGVHVENRVRMLEVQPLPEQVLRDLARDLLSQLDPGGKHDERRVDVIAREAKGSAYFVQELVRYIVAEPTSTTSKEDTLSSVIRARASRLSSEARRLLDVVCVAGWRISVGIAQEAAQLGPEERRAFVELRAGNFVKSTGTRESDTIEPYHDRVREMSNESLAGEDAKQVHTRIALAIESAAQGDVERTYALANHWFKADPADRQDHVFETNLRAGRTAADSYAYRQAHSYLSQAQEAAVRAGIALDTESELLIAEVQAKIGLAESAIALYESALSKSNEPLQRAATRFGISRVYLGWLDTERAIDMGLAALEELKLRPPKNKVLAWLSALRSLVGGLFRIGRVAKAKPLTGVERERWKLGSMLFVHLGLSYYFHFRPVDILRMTLQMLRGAVKLGPSRELVEWYILAGGASAALQKKKLNERLRRRAREYAEEIGDPVAVARSRLYRGIFCDMVAEPLRAEPLMARALEEHGPLFEPVDYYSGAACLAWNRLMRGRAQEGWNVIEQTLKLDAAGGQLNPVKGHSYRAYAAPLLAMMGRREEAREHAKRREEELVDIDAGARWRHSQQLSHTILYQYEIDDVGEVFDENVRKYEALELNAARLPFTMRHGFVGVAYGQRRQVELAEASRRGALLAKLRKTLDMVKVSTKGHLLLMAHRAVLEASYWNYQGKSDRARAFLDEAEQTARAIENDWVRYEVSMERARYAMSSDNAKSASKHLKLARDYASERGWAGRVERCDKLIERLSVVAGVGET